MDLVSKRGTTAVAKGMAEAKGEASAVVDTVAVELGHSEAVAG